MITRRAYTALSLAERQVIQSQYAGSGQCVRCFHHARRQQADELRPEDGSPAIKDSAKRAENNGPQIQPAPTKRARAQIISNEISALQRGPPPGDPTSGPGSLAGTNQTNPSPPTVSAGFTETPTSLGAGGRMGENISAGREGVNAQGVGRFSGSDERVRNEHSRSQGTRNPHEVQEPAEGGQSVLEQASAPRSSRGPLEGEARLRSIMKDARPLGLPVRPQASSVAAQRLVLQGRGTGVPLASQPIATIHDRFTLVTNPANNNRGRGSQRLSQAESEALTKVLVGGQYDNEGLLNGKKIHEVEILNVIKRQTMMNGTYLGKDGDRLVKKVERLLPASR